MNRLVAAGLLCLGAFRFGAPSQTYRVIDLGVYHPSHSSSATSVNDLGEAVGTVGPGTLGFAFRWTQARGVEPLPGLAPTWVSSFRWSTAKVNNAGQFCGSQQPRVGYQSAFRFTPGTGYERLRPMPGHVVSEALGMNARGEVAGYSSIRFSIVPTVWRPGRGPEFAGDLAFGIPTYANDINDQGLVAGMLTLHGTTDWRPYLWTQATGTRVLPVLPGRRYGTALAVNNLGVAAGYCDDFAFGADAVVWKADGALVDASDPSGTRSTDLSAINDHNMAVGHAYNNFGSWGCSWSQSEGFRLIDDSLDAEAALAGWHIGTCSDINQDGWITGSGKLPDGIIRPVLLIPHG